jgi:hypothetical protein
VQQTQGCRIFQAVLGESFPITLVLLFVESARSRLRVDRCHEPFAVPLLLAVLAIIGTQS